MKNDMRVIVTKRMLREGMLRCMETKPVSKITVSELCKESGVNRATFYNHYETPAMILRDIAYEYATQLTSIYQMHLNKQIETDASDDMAVEACLAYLSDQKKELKILFSDNAEHYLAGMCMELINKKVARKVSSSDNPSTHYEEYLLRAATAASATFGFIQIWLTMDIDKSPKELVSILKSVVRGNIFL